jgi:two-component system, LytTR family, response regulator
VSALRAVIVDDEPPARALLARMLAAHPEVAVVAECGDGALAVRAIEEHAPDVVFLDVQMPELDGFAVLRALPPERVPAVVFVTAYDEFALRAFEVHAVDYLLKPFDEERLARSVARVRDRLESRSGDSAAADLGRALAALTARRPFRERLAIRDRDRTFLLPVGEIVWIEAAGKHVQIHAANGSWLVRETLQQIESTLDPDRFVRVSRSAVVPVARIREIRPWARGESVIVLVNGTEVTTSKSYRENLEKLLRG